MTYKEIASKLEISPKTIHSHIKKIYGETPSTESTGCLTQGKEERYSLTRQQF